MEGGREGVIWRVILYHRKEAGRLVLWQMTQYSGEAGGVEGREVISRMMSSGI